MEFKEQAKSLLKFILLLVVTVGTAFWLFSAILNQDTPNPDQIVDEQVISPKPPTLTDAEVEVERFKIYKVKTEGGEVISFEPGTIASEVSSSSDLQTTPPSISDDNYSSSGLVAKPITLTDEMSYGNPVENQLQTFVLPNSGVEVISSSISYTFDDENDVLSGDVSIEGTIFSINSSLTSISLLLETNTLVNVSVNPTTQITINGKNILFSNLRVGDVIKVDGQRLNASTDVTAGLIDVVGSYQLIP